MNELWIAIAAIAGVLVGWMLERYRAGREDRRLESALRDQLGEREAEIAELRANESRLIAEHASANTGRDAAERRCESAELHLREASEQMDGLRAQLADATHALVRAETERENARTLLAEKDALRAEQLKSQQEAMDKALADVRDAFRVLSADALEKSAPEFLRLAGESFARLQETAKGDLAVRQEAIAGLLKPLEEQLRVYQERLQQSESSQSAVLGEVRRQLETLTRESKSLADETERFRMVLHSNQARGRWGEETLRRVVEAAGMSVHCDFSEQTSGEDGTPDMIVHLPGNRMILVDAKVPDLEFLQALDTADPAKRSQLLGAHARKLKDTIRDLAKRNYPAQFPDALDIVVLFLPAESLFSAALEGDRDLMVSAARDRILLATPASLIAILRSVSVSWQQYEQTENAREIARAARELFERVAKFVEHFEKIRRGLEDASKAYNEAVGSYERRVRPSGERLVKLAMTAEEKQLPEIRDIGGSLRLPDTTSAL